MSKTTTLQGSCDGLWLSPDLYEAIMDQIKACDSKSKNSIPPLVENKYHAGMTKEQCIEQFIEDAPHSPYEWDLHYLPEGGVMFYFSRECQFFFSIDEFKDFCKRIKDAERKYIASFNHIIDIIMTRENFDKAMELSNRARRIKDEMNYAASCMNRTMESEVSSMIKRSGMDNFLGRGEAIRVIMDAIGQLYNEEVARRKEILADIDRQIAEL